MQTKIEEPKLLRSLSAEAVKSFLAELEEYGAAGGAKHWTAFINPGLLAFVKYTYFEYNPQAQELFNFLYEISIQTTDNIEAIKERLRKIKVNEDEKTSLDKVRSLLISMEEALLELKLDEDVSNNGTDICVPLDTQIQLLLEKLPRGLQQKINQRMKFLPKITKKKTFANLLLDEAKAYEWPKNTK